MAWCSASAPLARADTVGAQGLRSDTPRCTPDPPCIDFSSSAGKFGPMQAEADPPHRTWMRRIAPLLLAVGLVVGVGPLLQRLPQEREIDLRLEDAATVVGLDLAWINADSSEAQGEGDALQASSWRFTPGTAPRSLRTRVRLPNGAYSVEITVSRTVGGGTTRRSITLGEADRVTLPIR